MLTALLGGRYKPGQFSELTEESALFFNANLDSLNRLPPAYDAIGFCAMLYEKTKQLQEERPATAS